MISYAAGCFHSISQEINAVSLIKMIPKERARVFKLFLIILVSAAVFYFGSTIHTMNAHNLTYDTNDRINIRKISVIPDNFIMPNNKFEPHEVTTTTTTTTTMTTTTPKLHPDLPLSVYHALLDRNTSGYLVGNSSHLQYYPYPDVVDLRVIILTFDRPKSLLKCLQSLQNTDFLNDSVAIEVWIDRGMDGEISNATHELARHFDFTHGVVRVHVQPQHSGVQGQWTNTWRPSKGTKEIGLILEDDMSVSPFFWRWLKRSHEFYFHRTDLSGIGLSHPGIAHATGQHLSVPNNYNIYLYPVICTWGFSPKAEKWRQFQDWFYHVEQKKNFLPLVPGILPTKWFLGERELGRERLLWEMWHIYFANAHGLYTLLLNSHKDCGLMAVNRHERGVHDQGTAIGAKEALCQQWKNHFIEFPTLTPKLGYNGIVKGFD